MANENSIKFSRSMSCAGVTVGGVDEIVLADVAVAFKQTVISGAVNYEVDMPITKANVLAIGFHSTQNVTIKTNSTSAPVDTIVVAKNVPILYSVNEPAAGIPISADVTKFYITNASGFDAVVAIGVAEKQAPTGPA
jgi:hypothetical protein